MSIKDYINFNKSESPIQNSKLTTATLYINVGGIVPNSLSSIDQDEFAKRKLLDHLSYLLYNDIKQEVLSGSHIVRKLKGEGDYELADNLEFLFNNILNLCEVGEVK
jgi:hypothetical protein